LAETKEQWGCYFLALGQGADNVILKALTIFGWMSVTAMLVFYALEKRSRWFILAFAVACALASVYGFLQGSWPFAAIEAIWSVVALNRWRHTPTTN